MIIPDICHFPLIKLLSCSDKIKMIRLTSRDRERRHLHDLVYAVLYTVNNSLHTETSNY